MQVLRPIICSFFLPMILTAAATGAWPACRLGGCRRLKTLRLGGSRLGDKLVEQLMAALRAGGCTSLTALDLSGNGMGLRGASAIAFAMGPGGPLASLETLSLSQNRIPSRGARAILHEALRPGGSLRVLELGHNAIRQRDWLLPCKFSTSASLLPGVAAGAAAKGEAASCPAEEGPALRVLKLNGNSLSHCFVQVRACRPSVNPGHLVVRSGFLDRGYWSAGTWVQVLGRALGSPSHPLSRLEELDLRSTHLGDKALEGLLGLIEYTLRSAVRHISSPPMRLRDLRVGTGTDVFKLLPTCSPNKAVQMYQRGLMMLGAGGGGASASPRTHTTATYGATAGVCMTAPLCEGGP